MSKYCGSLFALVLLTGATALQAAPIARVVIPSHRPPVLIVEAGDAPLAATVSVREMRYNGTDKDYSLIDTPIFQTRVRLATGERRVLPFRPTRLPGLLSDYQTTLSSQDGRDTITATGRFTAEISVIDARPYVPPNTVSMGSGMMTAIWHHARPGDIPACRADAVSDWAMIALTALAKMPRDDLTRLLRLVVNGYPLVIYDDAGERVPPLPNEIDRILQLDFRGKRPPVTWEAFDLVPTDQLPPLAQRDFGQREWAWDAPSAPHVFRRYGLGTVLYCGFDLNSRDLLRSKGARYFYSRLASRMRWRGILHRLTPFDLTPFAGSNLRAVRPSLLEALRTPNVGFLVLLLALQSLCLYLASKRRTRASSIERCRCLMWQWSVGFGATGILVAAGFLAHRTPVDLFSSRVTWLLPEADLAVEHTASRLTCSAQRDVRITFPASTTFVGSYDSRNPLQSLLDLLDPVSLDARHSATFSLDPYMSCWLGSHSTDPSAGCLSGNACLNADGTVNVDLVNHSSTSFAATALLYPWDPDITHRRIGAFSLGQLRPGAAARARNATSPPSTPFGAVCAELGQPLRGTEWLKTATNHVNRDASGATALFLGVPAMNTPMASRDSPAVDGRPARHGAGLVVQTIPLDTCELALELLRRSQFRRLQHPEIRPGERAEQILLHIWGLPAADGTGTDLRLQLAVKGEWRSLSGADSCLHVEYLDYRRRQWITAFTVSGGVEALRRRLVELRRSNAGGEPFGTAPVQETALPPLGDFLPADSGGIRLRFRVEGMGSIFGVESVRLGSEATP